MVNLEEVAVMTFVCEPVVLGNIDLIFQVKSLAELLLHRPLVGLSMGSLERVPFLHTDIF